MASDVDEIEKRLESFHTDVSEDDLFDYMEDKIKEEDEARKIHQAQFMAMLMNHKSIKNISSSVDDMKSWMKYGGSTAIALVAILISAFLAIAV